MSTRLRLGTGMKKQKFETELLSGQVAEKNSHAVGDAFLKFRKFHV